MSINTKMSVSFLDFLSKNGQSTALKTELVSLLPSDMCRSIWLEHEHDYDYRDSDFPVFSSFPPGKCQDRTLK
jgi:hypothetical protein